MPRQEKKVNNYVFNQCKECGEWFETDAPWKRKCWKCFIKDCNPQLYSNKFELKEILCKGCGQVFVDAPWKEFCFSCWLRNKKEEEMKEYEEREQYK